MANTSFLKWLKHQFDSFYEDLTSYRTKLAIHDFLSLTFTPTSHMGILKQRNYNTIELKIKRHMLPAFNELPAHTKKLMFGSEDKVGSMGWRTYSINSLFSQRCKNVCF